MLPSPGLLLCALVVLSATAWCKTVKHQWALSPQYNAPDGFYRMVFVVDGQSPGPTLVADEDDDFEIEIMNQLPVEMTVHW